MYSKRFIDELKTEFKARIEQKTGWGKKEVWVAFIEALVDAQAAVADPQEPVDEGPSNAEIDAFLREGPSDA
jgi:hypothetical protein